MKGIELETTGGSLLSWVRRRSVRKKTYVAAMPLKAIITTVLDIL